MKAVQAALRMVKEFEGGEGEIEGGKGKIEDGEGKIEGNEGIGGGVKAKLC